MRRSVRKQGFSMDIDTDGFDRLLSMSTMHEVAVGTYIEGEKIMTDSKQNYVPVITGNLRNAGTVLPPEFTSNSIKVTLTFDAGVAPYGYVVHERPATVGQGMNKFLEKPFLAHQNSVPINVGRYLASRIPGIVAGATAPQNAWQAYQNTGGTGDATG